VEFLGDQSYLTVHSGGIAFPDPYTVKPGEVFVLGDNRGNTLDSRAYNEGKGGGVPVQSVQAIARRFLFGSGPSSEIDLSRLFKRVDGLDVKARLEGLDAPALRAGIQRCLRDRPKQTTPPPPEEPSAANAIRP
jgi:signal peptidase I